MTMDKPILFSGPMVRAILDGRKTQTRRALKTQPLPPIAQWIVDGHWFIPQAISEAVKQQYITTWPDRQKSRYGKVGDRLWVRETFAFVSPDDDFHPIKKCNIEYRADNPTAKRAGNWDEAPDEPDAIRWKPSIHMPRWASRITLEVTGVKVERLKDISEADAKAEGIMSVDNGFHWLPDDPSETYATLRYKTICGAFQGLWESINGEGSWGANPWVVAISFSVAPHTTHSTRRG